MSKESERLTQIIVPENFGKVKLLQCYCLECNEPFTIHHIIGSYGVPIVCPKEHGEEDQVAFIDPFIERLLRRSNENHF